MGTITRTTSINSNDKECKSYALVSYILLTIGLFTAIPLLFGAIWAMIQKNGAFGTVYYSHLVNATRIFWWSLFWTIIGVTIIPFAIGFVVLGVIWLWVLFRLVDGFTKLLSDEPYPI